MPQNPANTSWLLSGKCLQATKHQPVSVNHENVLVYLLKKWMCVTLVLHSVCAEKRGPIKSQISVSLPLEKLDPHTPQLCQLVSQWQKLWVQAHSRQTRLEEHQQRLREVIADVLLCYRINVSSNGINCSLICPTGSILAFLTFLTA